MPNIEAATILLLEISITLSGAHYRYHFCDSSRNSQKTSTTVFYNMLTTDMVKKREKVVTITGWDIEVV